MMHPAAHMSTAGVYCCPAMTSGATYAGEPHCALSFPLAFLIFFARPKSAMRTEFRSFGRARIKFSSFKSLCAIDFSCMLSRPMKSCFIMHAASRS